MEIETILKKEIKAEFAANCTEITEIGGGGTGKVFRARFDRPPYAAAVKVAARIPLLKDERDAIDFLRARAEIKLPEIYFLKEAGGFGIMAMQFFDGVSAGSKIVLSAPKAVRERLAEEIAENLEHLQRVTGETFGTVDGERFDDWNSYYRPFAEKVADAADRYASKGRIPNAVARTMRFAFDRYDRIFDGAVSKPTLTHGDYWAPNWIVDRDFHLIGVVDPFHLLWAENEYELFALNAVFGKKLDVLGAWRKRNPTSEKFDLKSAFYYVFSEVFWMTNTDSVSVAYLKRIAKALKRQLKRFGLKP